MLLFECHKSPRIKYCCHRFSEHVCFCTVLLAAELIATSVLLVEFNLNDNILNSNINNNE